MISKDSQIIALLKEGKSYTQIQELLQVSPSKIAMIKRKYLTADNNNNESSSVSSSDSSSGSRITTDSDSFIENDIGIEEDDNDSYINEDNSNNIHHLKNLNMQTPQNTKKSNYYVKERSEVEKLKLQLAHKIDLKNIALRKEELAIKRSDIQKEKYALDVDRRRIEREGKALIFRFRKLMGVFKSGLWSGQQIRVYYNNITTLRDEIEEYCFKDDIDIEGLKILMLLNKTINFFIDCLEKIKETENEDIEDDEDDEEWDNDEDDDDDEDEDEDDNEASIQIVIDPVKQREFDGAQVLDFDDYE